jgi:hypothetical protein
VSPAVSLSTIESGYQSDAIIRNNPLTKYGDKADGSMRQAVTSSAARSRGVHRAEAFYVTPAQSLRLASSFQEIEVAFRSYECRPGSFLSEDLEERLSGKGAVCIGNIRESDVHDPVDQLDQWGVEGERIRWTKIRLSAAIPLTIHPEPEPPRRVVLHGSCHQRLSTRRSLRCSTDVETTRPQMPTRLATPVDECRGAGLSDDSRAVISALGTDVWRLQWITGRSLRSFVTRAKDVFTRLAAIADKAVRTEPSRSVTPALWARLW